MLNRPSQSLLNTARPHSPHCVPSSSTVGNNGDAAEYKDLWELRVIDDLELFSQNGAKWRKMGLKVTRMFTRCFPESPEMGKRL